LAIKHLAGERLQGTAAERAALTVVTTTNPSLTSWKLIARATLNANNNTIDTGTGNGTSNDCVVTDNTMYATPKENMMILIRSKTNTSGVGINGLERCSSGTDAIQTGNVYFFTHQTNGDNSVGSSSAESDYTTMHRWDTGGGSYFQVRYVDNHATNAEKLSISHLVSPSGQGATSVPYRVENSAKFVDPNGTSSQITRWQKVRGDATSKAFVTGSEMVVLGCDDDEADSGTPFWTQLGEHTLDADGSLDVSFTAKKYMMFEINTFNNSSDSSNMYIRFNGEDASTGASQYCKRQNSGTTLSDEETLSNESAIENPTYTGSDDHKYVQSIFCNETGQEKLGTGQSTGNSGTADDSPRKMEFAWKWIGSAQVSRITVVSASNPYGAGSSIRVWGSD